MSSAQSFIRLLTWLLARSLARSLVENLADVGDKFLQIAFPFIIKYLYIIIVWHLFSFEIVMYVRFSLISFIFSIVKFTASFLFWLYKPSYNGFFCHCNDPHQVYGSCLWLCEIQPLKCGCWLCNSVSISGNHRRWQYSYICVRIAKMCRVYLKFNSLKTSMLIWWIN